MAAAKTQFVCQKCGAASAKWLGRCAACGEWASLVEEAVRGGQGRGAARVTRATSAAVPSSAVPSGVASRKTTGIGELDRVLGGGLVDGSLVLVGGDPGIGKSTLLLQAAAGIARGAGVKVLYVSAEESVGQTALRAQRLGVADERVLLLSETSLETAIATIETERPAAVVVDSVQTVFSAELDGSAGSVGQIREVAARCQDVAKSRGIAVILVGHVTKDGALAGPKVLEHIVDTVLYFEGERGHPFRVLRAVKNRFGSASEVGVFDMAREGLREVKDPSRLLLAERPRDASGSVVVASAEGSRPMLVEIQALVASSGLGTPRRAATGFDVSRVVVLLAVLERSAKVSTVSQDVFVNVAGGVRVDERAADLGVVVAVASSARARPALERAVVFGEVGLSGELRAVSRPESRLLEARRLGYDLVILPKANVPRLSEDDRSGLTLCGCVTVEEAIDCALAPAT
ncbi:MAG: DNA repair protein RadA [Deltaproteobacteria bacterium]|nr:DNA repair protein RadA [Deltaproteobacteria bacterium]